MVWGLLFQLTNLIDFHAINVTLPDCREAGPHRPPNSYGGVEMVTLEE